MNVIICGGTVAHTRAIKRCPVEQRRRRMVLAWDASPYYGPTITCCGCGDTWQDGELLSRPFCPGWREENIARAKELWKHATAGMPERDEHGYIVGGAA